MYYYVYRITCNHPNSKEKYYYGSRGSKNLPLDDNYWSSSRYVKAAIQLYGIKYFKKKIIKTFDTQQAALQYEILLHEKFNVSKNDVFFNRSKQTIWGVECTGSVVKGKSYEEIYGIQKAVYLRELRSKQTKGKNNKGVNNPMHGKKHTSATKQLLSVQKIGDKHPQFGYFWITNETYNKKVPPDYIIEDGWRRGRVHVHSR